MGVTTGGRRPGADSSNRMAGSLPTGVPGPSGLEFRGQASGASHPRGALLADLHAVRRVRSLVRAFAPGVAGTLPCCPRLDGVNVLAMGNVYLCGIRTGNVARRAG